MAGTVVIPGPGDMNAMNGLKNALNDCTPLLHMAVETEPEIRGGDGIHETPPDTYDNVVKGEHHGRDATEHRRRTATSDRHRTDRSKGPVRVGIPKNFLKMDVTLAEQGEVEPQTFSGVPEAKVETAADLLADASKPIIIAGGGIRASEASDELRAVAERPRHR